MKKIIALVLSLILVFSSMSVVFVNVSAEETTAPTNYAPSSWQAGAHWYNNGGRIGQTEDNHLGGKAFTVTLGSPNYQYVDAEQTVTLNPNTQYRFGISVKGITAETKGLLEALMVYKGGTKIESGNSETFPSNKRIAYASSSIIDENLSNDSWTRLYFDFTTTDETAYDLRLRWGNISSYTISDITLYAKANNVYEIEGNGKVVSSESNTYLGQTVSFTAVPDSGEAFIGWYTGETLLSNSETYNYTILSDSTSITAKFTSNNVSLMDETKWGISGRDTNATITKANDVISVNDVQWNFFYIPMSLKTDTTYALNFDIRSEIQLERLYIVPASCGVEYKDDGNYAGYDATVGLVSKSYTSAFTTAKTWYENNSLEFTTNSTENNYYIVIKTAAQLTDSTVNTPMEFKNMYIRMVPFATSAEIMGNGEVEVSKDFALEGDKVVYTAIADEEEYFLGWYVGETLVSTNAEYLHTFTADGNKPTAKFTTYNLMKAELWKTSPRDTNATVELSNGIVAIKEIQWNFFYIPVHLKTNTYYSFDFNFRSQIKAEKLTIYTQSCGLEYNASSGEYVPDLTNGGERILYQDSNYGTNLKNFVAADTWYNNNSVTFKTNSTDTDYYIIIKTGDKLSGATATTPVEFSNAAISESLKTAVILTDEKTGRKGNAAIRAASDAEGGVAKNGLRIYNAINKQFITDNHIIEYGSIVIAADKVQNPEDLLLETENIKKGLAFRQYNTENGLAQGAILWKEDGFKNVFTSYLTNIKAENYGNEYLIRSYAISSTGTVYYGDVISACIYDVVYAIDNDEAANDVSINAFNTFVNKNRDNYSAWCTKKGYQTGILFNKEN